MRIAIVAIEMSVSLLVSDKVRRRRCSLPKEMVDAMGRRKDEKEQERNGGIQTQATLGERELFSKSYHRFKGNPKVSCRAAQAPVCGADVFISP